MKRDILILCCLLVAFIIIPGQTSETRDFYETVCNQTKPGDPLSQVNWFGLGAALIAALPAIPEVIGPAIAYTALEKMLGILGNIKVSTDWVLGWLPGKKFRKIPRKIRQFSSDFLKNFNEF